MMKRARHQSSGPVSATDPGLSEQVADAMFALSTPSRVRILAALLDEAMTVGDLTETLGLEQSAVSHQLRVLREHQLVRAQRDGRRRIYSLEDEHVRVLINAALDHVERLSGGAARRPLSEGAAG